MARWNTVCHKDLVYTYFNSVGMANFIRLIVSTIMIGVILSHVSPAIGNVWTPEVSLLISRISNLINYNIVKSSLCGRKIADNNVR